MKLKILLLEIFFTTMNKDKKILYVNWGGLGDHLSFSTLPEIFNKNNYEFYISDKSVFRSSEIYDLVWRSNPYVKGLTNEQPNCGHLENWGKPIHEQVVFEKSISMHTNIEKIYGIHDGSNYAKIYYKPKNIINYKNKIFLDLNAISVTSYNIDLINKHLINYKNHEIIVSISKYGQSVVKNDFFNNMNVEFVETKNIFEYVDFIYSVKKFICLWSGSSVLSSAVKNMYKKDLEIECFKKIIDDKAPIDFGGMDKSYYWYDNIDYILI